MKYQLLWTACVIGLLQLSVVTCRRAHDKVTNKENEEYSTTVSPPVAYTGQEIERALNSSDKLALDPGVMSSDTQRYRFNWILVFLLVFFGCLILSFLILGCIAIYYWQKKIKPGMIVNNQGHANQSRDLQFSAAPIHQPTNAPSQQLTLTCQKCHKQSPLSTQFQPVQQLTGYQHQNTQPENLPSTVHAVYQVPHSAVPVGHMVLLSQTQEQPAVIEFENPVSCLKQPD